MSKFSNWRFKTEKEFLSETKNIKTSFRSGWNWSDSMDVLYGEYLTNEEAFLVLSTAPYTSNYANWSEDREGQKLICKRFRLNDWNISSSHITNKPLINEKVKKTQNKKK
jgi:hypothetical protein